MRNRAVALNSKVATMGKKPIQATHLGKAEMHPRRTPHAH